MKRKKGDQFKKIRIYTEEKKNHCAKCASIIINYLALSIQKEGKLRTYKNENKIRKKVKEAL